MFIVVIVVFLVKHKAVYGDKEHYSLFNGLYRRKITTYYFNLF